MEKLPIKTIIILCVSIFVYVSCQELNNNSVADAISDSQITVTDGITSNISQFVHPGILNSQESLDVIKSDLSSERTAGFQKVTEFINNNPVPTNFPSTVYVLSGSSTPSEYQMRRDGILAYAHALAWAKTGTSSHANNAITILNGWSGNFQQIKACAENDDPNSGCPTECLNDQTKCPLPEQRRLQAAWVAPTFAAAAEIIRDYKVNGNGTGWPSNDISDFKGFLKELNDEYIKSLVSGIQPNQGSPWSWASSNWGASGAWAKMAIAVFRDNSSSYNHAMNKIPILINNMIDNSSGELNECVRDCKHPQYSTTALTYAAETARIQGSTSLYSAHSEGIKKGWEWLSDAFQGTVSCDGNSFSCISETVYPGIEVALNYYKTNKLEGLKNEQNPYGITSDVTFLGFTTYTHYDVSLPATATATAVNQPTSNTTVVVVYTGPGHGYGVTVNYNSGESINNMLIKMRNAINSDQNIQITAGVNLSNNTIKFTEKNGGSFGNSNKVVVSTSGGWQNGPPFNPNSPMIFEMSGGTD